MKRKKIPNHDWHHRKPQSLGGESTDENMSHVSVSKHQSWHSLFNNKSPQEIAKIINEVWLDPEFYFSVKKRR